MNPLTWFGLGCAVFLAAFAYDWAYARYVAAVAAAQARPAALWSAALATFGLVGLLGILQVSAWLALPEIAGYACGTYVGIARSGRS